MTDQTNPGGKKAAREIVYEYVMEKLKTDKDVVIRTGDAPALLDEVKPDKIRLNGTIAAPWEFFNKRKEKHDPFSAHVVFNKNTGFLKLVLDERYGEQNYEITGQIVDHPDLAPFCINKDKTFDVKKLMDVLKFNRIHFDSREVNNKLVGSLQNFKAKAEQTLTDISNNRGSEDVTKLTRLEHELEEDFVLVMPIHKGGRKVKFKVDVCVTARSGKVEVWLESKELKELQQSSIDGMVDEQVALFKPLLVCIEQ